MGEEEEEEKVEEGGEEENEKRGDTKKKRMEETNKCKIEKYVKQEKKVEEKRKKAKEKGMKMERTVEKDEEGEEKEQMDSLDEEEEGEGDFKNEDEEVAIEPKEGKAKGSERRRRKKDDWKREEEDKRIEGFLEREREDEEVMVVSRVKDMMGVIVWEYAEQEYAEWEYAAEFEQTTEEDQAVLPSYTWDTLDRGFFFPRRRDVFSKRRRIGTGEHCLTNREITRRRRGDECVDVWCPLVAYHESEEACYVFSDNTCVVCARVVFTGQCIFHK